MNIEDPAVWFAILTGLVFFVTIYYFFVRWLFSIEKQLKNQEMIIELLMKIANDEKVSDEQRKTIKNYIKK